MAHVSHRLKGSFEGALAGGAIRRLPHSPVYVESLQKAFPAILAPVAMASPSTLAEAVAGSGTDLLVVAREARELTSAARPLAIPVLFVSGAAHGTQRYPRLSRVIVALDGSREAEATLPFAARLLAPGAQLQLLRVPDGGTVEQTLHEYGTRVAAGLRVGGSPQLVVAGSGPARTNRGTRPSVRRRFGRCRTSGRRKCESRGA